MGVFNKLKSIFYDEVVVEDETQDLDQVSKIVKKESTKDEAPRVEELKFKTVEIDPIKEEKEDVIVIPDEKEEEPKKEVDLFRSERTFNYVDFSDDEVEEIKEPEPSQRKNVLDEPARVMRSTEPARDDSQKVFRPTPVISPIWGVLDKDYKKDEIKEKTVTNESFTSSITDYDNVRRKAYGTLEDELEDTLNTANNKVTTDDIKEELKNKKETSEVLEGRTAKIEDLIDKIDEATEELDKSMSIEEAENTLELESLKDEDEEKVEESDKTLTDSTLEHDLFNLIDSMYDKEE